MPIGTVGNKSHENIKIGKAGRSRWLGKRPKVRGVAMNPVDHPHGGGEGRTSGGRHPVSPWGTPAKGYKTRKKNKPSNKFIVKSENSAFHFWYHMDGDHMGDLKIYIKDTFLRNCPPHKHVWALRQSPLCCLKGNKLE